jgi:glycosyltransferase involved in cell wall biosynthesis
MNSRFTFCIPNLNKMQFLPACIDSVLAQDSSNWCCVFVDGYSTDGSWEYMQQFASDPRFLLFRGRQRGMYEDWNECLKHVKTEYFYFLPSDDTCFPNLVSTTTAALDAYPDIDACHFKFIHIDKAGTPLGTPDSSLEFCSIYAECNQYAHRRSGLCEFMMHFAYRAIYQTMTSLVFRYNLISKLNGFSSEYGSAGDMDWTMRLGLLTDILYIPELLATWRVYEEQSTKKMSRLNSQDNFLRIAQANLDAFILSERSFPLKNKINRKELLVSFNEGRASALYEAMISARDLDERLKYGAALVRFAPQYIVRKIINRLSKDKLYRYQNWNEIAQHLICHYELMWPPTSLNLNMNQPIASNF